MSSDIKSSLGIIIETMMALSKDELDNRRAAEHYKEKLQISESSDPYQLMYAEKSGGTWNNKIVVTENTGTNIIHTSLTIDSSNTPHILYIVFEIGNDEEMKYATREYASSSNLPIMPVVISLTLMATIAILTKREIHF